MPVFITGDGSRQPVCVLEIALSLYVLTLSKSTRRGAGLAASLPLADRAAYSPVTSSSRRWPKRFIVESPL